MTETVTMTTKTRLRLDAGTKIALNNFVRNRFKKEADPKEFDGQVAKEFNQAGFGSKTVTAYHVCESRKRQRMLFKASSENLTLADVMQELVGIKRTLRRVLRRELERVEALKA